MHIFHVFVDYTRLWISKINELIICPLRFSKSNLMVSWMNCQYRLHKCLTDMKEKIQVIYSNIYQEALRVLIKQ